MKLSVVIPTLNEAENVASCVESAFALGKGWSGEIEVIVADGGSGDETGDFARQAGAIVVISPAGRGNQLNEGFLRSSGDLVLMLHADTRLDSDAGSQLAGAFQDPGVTCGAFRQRIEAVETRYRWLEAGNAWRARWFGMPYGDQAIFARRTALEAIGGVPQLSLMEDVELMRQLRRHGWPVLLAGPLRVSARRWRENGVIQQTAKNWALVVAYHLGVAPERLSRWYRTRKR